MRRLVLLAALALATAVIAAPVQAATRGCDLTGDANRADDCITHSHVGATADGNMRAGDTISLREHVAEALRGRPLVVEVQVRRVARDGRKGTWVGLRRTRWTAAGTAAHATRTVDVCRAKLAGRYEFRTATRVPRAALTGPASRQAAGQIATSAPTMVNLPNRGVPGGCPNSPDDEVIIEYFNEVEFDQDLYVVMQDQGTSFALTLSCPPQQSPNLPPANFGLVMALEGAPTGMPCNGGPIVLDKATLDSGSYAGCVSQPGVPRCTFDFLAYDEQTQVVYSDTIVEIAMTPGTPNTTYIPNLNPATLPICPANLNPCILTGQCSLSTTKVGTLALCTGADSCAPPHSSGAYSYNENVYFQTSISPHGA